MIDLEGVEHHAALSEMVDVLCARTQNTDAGFFRAEVAYFLAKMASSQRAVIKTKDRGDIPVNLYALCLATSGFGKGHSISVIEEEFMKGFKTQFMQDTLPLKAEENCWAIANDRAARNGGDQQEEFNKVEKEYRSAGAFPFTFDSGTVPAVKQLRQKLLMANAGSINLQIDEIGLNLIANTEVLTVFLELYDQGRVKPKLVKNTAENQRSEDIDGKTPTNMLLFGTPSMLLDGGPTESQFYSFLDTGYARRCIFGYGQHHKKAHEVMTPAEIYARRINPLNTKMIQKWAGHFHQLAHPNMWGWEMVVEDEVAIKLVEYQAACEKLADSLPDHEEIRKAELNHRYFKALKLAGAYAFVDVSNEVEMGHLLSAILLVEESGNAFQTILSREKAYVKLAKYIANVGQEVTHADLVDALPFYKTSAAFRNEIMPLATAWGYKNNVIIKKSFRDTIEFFKGETLTETNLAEVMVSYSDNFAYSYLAESIPFSALHQLTQAKGLHWCNHHFKNGLEGKGHRTDENALPGFNLVVLDVDGGTSVEMAAELLKDYTFLIYTTKRHTDDENRFRIIIPTNYHLELDSAEYKEFMNEVMAWIPFPTDEAANKREKKWETFDGGNFAYNEGQLLDVLPFIPKTSRNQQFRERSKALANLDSLERWFADKIATGNRNNQMIKYALALVDSGMSLIEVSAQVHSFNKKLEDPMTEDEIDRTILVTVGKRFQQNP